MLTFLQGIFLWGALAVAIPLLLHLLSPRRAVPVPFGTIRFLKAAQKRSSARIRLEHFLLWLIRSLLILLLVLAFALPVLRTSGFGGWLGRARRDVAIVLDVSFSMGYATPRGKVWERAIDAATAIVQGLQDGDRVCIFLAGEETKPLIELPTEDLDLAMSLLREQHPGHASSELRGAILAARDALEADPEREKELFVITDGQEVPWRKLGAADPSREVDPDLKPFFENVASFVVAVGSPHPVNASIQGLRIEPELLIGGKAGQLVATVSGSGPDRNLPVTLTVNGEAAGRREVLIPSGQYADAEILLPELAPGTHEAFVEVPPDGLAADDRFHFLLRVFDRIPVLCVGESSAVYFVRHALDPGGEESRIDVTTLTPGRLGEEPLHRFVLVVLCDALPLDGQHVLALEDYVRSGGTLVVFPGDRAGVADYRPFQALPAQPTHIDNVPRDEAYTPLYATGSDDNLPQPQNNVSGITLSRRLSFRAPIENERVLLRTRKGRPFLLAHDYEEGRVLLFAVAADRSWSDFPLSPQFLPILHRAVRQGSGVSRSLLVEEAAIDLALPPETRSLVDGSMILGPDGEPVVLRAVRGAKGDRFFLQNATAPGVYRAGPDGLPLLTVHLPPQESDLAPVPINLIAQWIGGDRNRVVTTLAELLKSVEAHRTGRPLAELFLWIALVLAVFETLLANRMSRTPKTLHETLTVDPSGRVKEHG
jgi:hypothetical protein